MNRVKDFIKRLIPDSIFLRIKFRRQMGQSLHLKYPQTFNEKLQWLKLHDRKPEYTKLVDKYEVKKCVANIIGDQYIIPTYGVWNCFDEIDFNSLPDQFVLKCTHDSGGIIICSDKKSLDIEAARDKINKCMKRNYYWVGREWPYKNVRPRIIAEKYLIDETKYDLHLIENEHYDLRDYKAFCFNGIAKIFLVCSERNTGGSLKETFYNEEWERLPFKRSFHETSSELFAVPKQFEQMKKLAHAISEDIPFARVDFYEVNRKLYFGEITFYPASGVEGFKPVEWDYILGEMLALPQTTENRK